MSKKFVPWLALAGLLALAFIVIAPFVVPLAWASILCYASWPAAQRIRQWCKNRDSPAATITTFFAAITLFLPLIWLAWLAQQEHTHIYPALEAFFAAPLQVPAVIKNLPWLSEGLNNWLLQKTALFAHR